MKCSLRRWQMSDANELARALNNQTIHGNLRDGLPFLTLLQMHRPIFNLSQRQNSPLRSLWMIELWGVLAPFAKKTSILEQLR